MLVLVVRVSHLRGVKTLKILGREFNVSSGGEVEALAYVNSYGRRIRGKALTKSVMNNGYTSVTVCCNGSNRTTLLHRLVAKAFLDDYSEKLDVDHIDGNRRNNSVENLRMVTRRMNLRSHRTPSPNISSSYRGVTYDKKNKKWRTKVHADGKHYCGGRHASEIEAARAYNRLAQVLGFNREALNEIA